MTNNRSMPPGDVIPEIPYADVADAAAWLCRAFGFSERLRIGGHRVQVNVGTGSIVVAKTDNATAGCRCTTLVRVASIDAHYDAAQQNGAVILRALATHPYGERQYTAEDSGGHHWTFSESVADIDPRDWGGELVAARA